MAVPNSINKVSIILGSMLYVSTEKFIKTFINFYKPIYKYG